VSLTFILGGARSGKSAYAVQRANDADGRVLFVATAEAFDDDMRDRIARHKAERPMRWNTLEAPLGVGAAVAAELAAASYDTVVVDCITLLVSNALLRLPEDTADNVVNDAVLVEIDALLGLISHSGALWLIVSNEVGMGVVPPTRLGRVYRDVLGRANQRLAQAADEVTLLVAGLPWKLRG
jgi:adenosylcobinamide kinase/adenosylcobinamide-phosphate guanylyltransferase